MGRADRKAEKAAQAAERAANPEPSAPPAADPADGLPGPLKELVAPLDNGLELWKVHVDALREQDLNARSMPPHMMQRLASTIGRDSRLESLPLVADTGGKQFELVSGHHRVRAARTAELPHIFVLVDVAGLTPSQVKAKQLAHNAIQGFDEAQLVKRIFDEITDVDARLEAAIDPKALSSGVPDKVDLPKVDLNIDYRTTLITFLPHQQERFDAAVDQIIAAGLADDRDRIYVADAELYGQWNAVMQRLRKEYDARAISVVIAKFIEAAAELLGVEGTDPADLDPTEWVPLTSLLGTAMVPPDVAPVIKEAVDKIAKQEDIKGKAKWRAIEYLCADWLAGG
jgi:hypothetical protein